MIKQVSFAHKGAMQTIGILAFLLLIKHEIHAEVKNQVESTQSEIVNNSLAQAETVYKVTTIEVIGSTIFTEEDLAQIINPLENQSLTRQDLDKVAEAITQLYLEEGYLTSRAIFEPTDFNSSTGIVQIKVIEGRLTEINIEGAKRLEKYLRARLELAGQTPVNVVKLEEQLRLLKVNPLFESIEATLKAGEGVNETVLDVTVKEANPFYGSLGFNNYSPPSVGSTRMDLILGTRNLIGIGDEFSVFYSPRLEAFTGTYNLDIRYSIPVNPRDGRLQFATAIENNKIINDDLEEFDITGENETYSLIYRQPIYLSINKEVALSFGFEYSDGQTFLLQQGFPFGEGPEQDGVSRTSVFIFGQEYIQRDSSGVWGVFSQFRLGTGILNATVNPSDIPDSRFLSWLAQVQRVQVINSKNFLIIQADMQLSTDPLLPSEQFVIGGGMSVYGYRQNVRSGDNGIRFLIEDRITLVQNNQGGSLFSIIPFFNLGYVWNHPNNPNELPDQNFLAALGLGLLLETSDRLTIRLDYAPPLIDLDDRGNNIQDDGLYFSINYNL